MKCIYDSNIVNIELQWISFVIAKDLMFVADCKSLNKPNYQISVVTKANIFISCWIFRLIHKYCRNEHTFIYGHSDIFFLVLCSSLHRPNGWRCGTQSTHTIISKLLQMTMEMDHFLSCSSIHKSKSEQKRNERKK